MIQHLDLVIFSSFLVINLLVGLFYSRGVTNISEYAIGKRDFSTATIVATLVATWIGAGFFSYTLIETYRQGLYFLIPTLGDSLGLMIVGYFFAPRMGEFLGKLSVAEAMGDLFGKKVKFVTVITGIIACIGGLGIQFKVSGKVLELIFGTSGTYATLLSAAIVILYSTFGGIRAVTFTDVIQFFTFGCIIPIIATIAWDAISDHQVVVNTLTTNPSFDFKQVFDFGNFKFYQMLFLLTFFLVPQFSPMIFQRALMANSPAQIARSFNIAGFFCLIIQLIIASISIFILSDNPNLNPDNLLSYIIDHYAYLGFKGLIAVGIMAVIMSSADSVINSMSVMFAHDLCKPLGFKWSNNELLVSRVFSVVSGVFAIYFALKVDSILNLVKLAWGFYAPVVAIPLIFAIFGFRSSGKSVLIGMIAAIITIFVWKLKIEQHTDIDSFVPGVAASIIFLFGSHYFLKQPGGWVGIKDKNMFEAFKQEKKRERQKLINSIMNFSFMDFCKKNAPDTEVTYSYFGFFALLTIFMTVNTIPTHIRDQYTELVDFLYKSSLILSCYFLTYPIWPKTFRNENLISVSWIVGVFYILVFSATVFLVISNLAQSQMLIFFINMIIISVIFKWHVALFMIAAGVLSSIAVFQNYAGAEHISPDMISLELKIMFCLLLFSSILITFLKPIQQTHDRKLKLFSEAEKQIKYMSEQMLNLLIMKQEFVNNINHEIRTPIHHIGSSVYAMHQDWNGSSEDQKREYINTIYEGYNRIKEYMNNILDLSDLSTNKIQLRHQKVDVHNLTQKVLDDCKDLYLENNNLQFNISVQASNVIVVCDEEKISHAIKHLIKNAIAFTSKGLIEISLSNQSVLNNNGQNVPGLKFSIKDSGIGIPKNEISYIFGPFIQSSYTKTSAGGRGLGLALCERIIKIHRGVIWAENNSHAPGATFAFIIPL
jgi:hypothetical protein